MLALKRPPIDYVSFCRSRCERPKRGMTGAIVPEQLQVDAAIDAFNRHRKFRISSGRLFFDVRPLTEGNRTVTSYCGAIPRFNGDKLVWISEKFQFILQLIDCRISRVQRNDVIRATLHYASDPDDFNKWAVLEKLTYG